MNWLSVLMFSLIVNGVGFQTTDARKWNRVELMCGKLVHVEKVPIKGAANSFTVKTTPIKSALLRIYHWNEDTRCCEGLQPVAKTNSRSDGSFQFDKAVPGDYWIVAKIDGEDHKLAITYAPDKKTDVKCSDTLYAPKKDQLQLERVIVVD